MSSNVKAARTGGRFARPAITPAVALMAECSYLAASGLSPRREWSNKRHYRWRP